MKAMFMEQKPKLMQKLVFSQTQQQSLAILTMPVWELCQYLQKQMVENILLEFTTGEKDNEEDYFLKELKYLLGNEERRDSSENYHKEEALDLLDIYADDSSDLYTYLRSQLAFYRLNTDDERICDYIIYNLNQYGFLETSLADICRKFSCAEDKAQGMLDIIRGLDPAGIGSADIVQCLIYQLTHQEANEYTPLAVRIVTDHLEDLSCNRLSLISKKTRSSLDDVIAAKQIILVLNPYPGLAYGQKETINYCYPDIVVRIIDKMPTVIINDKQYASLRFNKYYVNMIKSKNEIDKKTYDYLKEKYYSAKNILKAVDQRKQTLHRIADSIVTIQYDYFLGARDYLSPMTLKDVSRMVGLHESTVSRAVSGKYLAYDKGMIEIKKMFNKAVNETGSQAPDQIKKSIKDLIAAEDPRKPLSDQKIGELLSARNIYIARRTIAKYREELGIYSSSKRKQY